MLQCFILSKKGRSAFRKKHKNKHESFKKDYHFVPLKKDPIIIDCGANVGASVLFFLKHHPGAHITCFEADPQIFNEKLIPDLKEKIPSTAKVDFHNEAVWINDEGLIFHQEGELSGSSVAKPKNSNNSIKVPSIRLRDTLESHQLIDLLKIDIEGAEVKVIEDCAEALARVDHLFVEYHSFVGQKQELSKIISVLESLPFRYRITEDYNPKGHYLTYGDNRNNMDCQIKIFAVHQRVIDRT